MRHRSKLTVALLLAATVMSTASCGKETSQSGTESSYYKVSIDGEQTTISEDDEEISHIKKLAEDFLAATIVKDYKNPVGDSDLAYYTKEVAETHRANGTPENSVATMETYKLVQEYNGLEVEKIEVYKLHGQDAASVSGEFFATVTECTDEYPKAIAWEKNVKYKRAVTLICVIEDGQWKVSELSGVGAREKAN